ncbi:MAG: tRNA modification GTPase [Bacteroidetes bacterium]|nr:tRNA modification GTPase [Bacteroidota bacterium]
MKIKLLLSIIFLVSIHTNAQIIFEKGYFINNNDQITECLIKNIDWRKNPTGFEYKLLQNDLPKEANISTVKEFGVYNYSKYIRAFVKIDRSPTETNELSYNRNPIWSEEILFLKVLTEGPASLYNYIDERSNGFFFNKNNGAIEQLVCKNYLNNDNTVSKNIYYKQQLLNNVNCKKLNALAFTKIRYFENELVKHFNNNNLCEGEEIISYKASKPKKQLHLKITPGINFSSISVQNNDNKIWKPKEDVDFDSKTNFRIGMELEYIFPFNKNKWAFITAFNYQYYKDTQELETQIATVNYQSIELSMGLRYYIYLNSNSKIFLNAIGVYDFNLDSSIEYERSRSDFEIRTTVNTAFGLGYNFNKFSAELRIYSRRNLLMNHIGVWADYNNLSFIIGYNIL